MNRIKFLLFLIVLSSCNELKKEKSIHQEVLKEDKKTVLTVEKDYFKIALDSLIRSKYQYEIKQIDNLPIDSSSIVHGFNLCIKDTVGIVKKLENLPIQHIEKVRFARIKGKTPMSKSSKFYARAYIEEWIFETEIGAKDFVGYFDENRNKTREWICLGGKAPLSYFHVKNKFYYVLTGGEYMYKEDEKLKELLLKYLE